MIGQGELRTPHASRLTPHASRLTPHAAREHEQKLYVPPSGDIIKSTCLHQHVLLCPDVSTLFRGFI